MNMRLRRTVTSRTIAGLALTLILAGCTSSGDSGEQADDTTKATTSSTEEETTGASSTSTPADDTSDEETTTTAPGTLEDSTEDADETLPPPSSLVPEDFCEPTRVDGQAIRFQPGAEQALLRSPSAPGQSDLYSVEVTDGQIMTVSISSDNADVVATLLPPDGVFVPGAFTETSVTETQAGNYWICVVSGDTSGQYELAVSVIDDNTPTKVSADWCGTDVNDRGEIRFAAGASSGQVDDGVIRGERDLYTLDAGAGQQFSGELSAFEQNASLLMRSPSGDVVLDTETLANTAGFSIQLPETGLYELCIGSTRGNATYTLDLTIE